MKKINILLLIIFTIISLSQEWKIKSHDSDKFLKQRKYEQALDLALQSLNEVKAIYGE